MFYMLNLKKPTLIVVVISLVVVSSKCYIVGC